MKYLLLTRPVNLVFIVIAQLLLKFSLFPMLQITTALSTTHFVLLVLATILIAAGGNVINDVYDVAIDAINKPEKRIVGKTISEKNATTFYIILTILGVGIGFYLANYIQKISFAAIFIVVAALLYSYASYLKSMVLVGNILISILVAFSLLIVILFDIFPVLNDAEMDRQSLASAIIVEYALFAFYFNLIRELIKDIQDINGDKNGGMQTLPILLGRKRSNYLGIALVIFGMTAILYYIYVIFYLSNVTLIYFLLALIAPLLLYISKAWNAESKTDYGTLSLLLKVVLFLGLCSIPTLNYLSL